MGQQHNQPGYTDQSLIRNFCIIAHIDHGKSTVADRILQLSGIVPEREMRDRFLDRMDIEQERGITIKSQAVRVPWTVDGTEYTLGMIDTPRPCGLHIRGVPSVGRMRGCGAACRRHAGH